VLLKRYYTSQFAKQDAQSAYFYNMVIIWQAKNVVKPKPSHNAVYKRRQMYYTLFVLAKGLYCGGRRKSSSQKSLHLGMGGHIMMKKHCDKINKVTNIVALYIDRRQG
jgi:hypothetical protein